MTRAALAVFCLCWAFALDTVPALGQGVRGAAAPHGTAVLQGLDKTTARISTLEAPVDGPVLFGSLEIVARVCFKTPPEEPPESSAFLEITDIRPDRPRNLLFSGWMFASSPAVSALEHPVYDVWVVDCRHPLAEDPGGGAPTGVVE